MCGVLPPPSCEQKTLLSHFELSKHYVTAVNQIRSSLFPFSKKKLSITTSKISAGHIARIYKKQTDHRTTTLLKSHIQSLDLLLTIPISLATRSRECKVFISLVSLIHKCILYMSVTLIQQTTIQIIFNE